MSFDRLWAGWRSNYVSEGTGDVDPEQKGSQCVFCVIANSEAPFEETFVLWKGKYSFAILNAFPYVAGHILIMPLRHVSEMEELNPQEASEIWDTLRSSVIALKSAYSPQGINLGANMGRAAGAGIPGHFHFHALPRWNGDTNFMTSIASVRVLPESLPVTWNKLVENWPNPQRN